MTDEDDYLDRARRLRLRAAMVKSREARLDLLWLAAEYETLAEHLAATAARTNRGDQTRIKDKEEDSG